MRILIFRFIKPDLICDKGKDQVSPLKVE
jgi:hypothetical protein